MWIKITTDIFDDEKIQLIESMPEGDTLIVIWFKLLTLAGKTNNSGLLLIDNKIKYSDEMLAILFRRSLSVIRLALRTFEQFGMIEIIDGVITIPKWDEHQNEEALTKYRLDNRNRQARHREKIKQQIEQSQEEKKEPTDVKETEEIKEPKKRERKPFIPPTLEEIKQYCQERKNNVNPETFYKYYSKLNWTDSNGRKVKNWKQKIISVWEGNNSNPSFSKRRSIEEFDSNTEKLEKYTFNNFNLDEQIVTSF
jgi:predicted phage replisome organizer